MKIGYSCVLFLAASTYAHMPPLFTRDVFLETWAVNEKTPNIIVSPYSLIAPLGTLVLASEGMSQEQILKAFNIEASSQMSEMYTQCKQHVENVGNVVINTANRLYITRRVELLPEFNSAAKHVYDVDVKCMDFSKPDKAAKEINKWVEMKTESRIKELIDSSSLRSSTLAVLVNTIYFDGKWTKQFDRSVKRKFYTDDSSTVEVSTMTVKTRMKYGYNEELEAEVVSIPYKDEKCSFVIVLPNNKTKVDNLRIKLKRNGDAINNALKTLSEMEIQLSMPVFEFETKTDLKIMLQNLNIKDIFSSKAKLTGMMKGDLNLFIESAIQKAYIKVNEEGTQAAAANAFMVYSMGIQYIDKEVEVDRPFYFEIRCSAITLFSGLVRKP